MKFPTKYKCLTQSEFELGNYMIVPLRYEDRMDIMKWRNEQMYHLRQAELLTKEKQEDYFNNIVSNLFELEQPNQILFSYLENDKCIGYGGLVHINWIDKNAEISFIMDTRLEEKDFDFHWSNFLSLIDKAFFSIMNFHKLSTYAFDLRPHIYPIFEKNGFYKEAVLKEHCLYEGEFKDVIIHAKIKN